MRIAYDGKAGQGELLAYVDANHATDLDARRPMLEGGGGHASIDGEFLFFEDAASVGAVHFGIGVHGRERRRQGLHFLRQVQRLMRPEYCVNVTEENKGAIKTVNNPINSYRTNNMDVQNHFLRQHVQEKTIDIIHVGTGQQHAGVINKALNTTRYKRHMSVVMNVS